jgi:hypothetical protein
MKGLRIVSKTPEELRTSTILDREILELIKLAMAEKGYGQRQRSKWINEAIQAFQSEFEVCDSAEQVETLSHAAILSENGGHITVVLRPESVEFIEGCRGLMSTISEDFDINAQSRLIHFAITFRLIREKYL